MASLHVESWKRTIAYSDGRALEATEALAEDQGVVVEIRFIGEGWSGDYNIDDPDDRPLLRFDVWRRLDDGTLEPVGNASYCTMLRADARDVLVKEAAQFILREVRDAVIGGSSIKKTCERLSWVGRDQV